MRLVPVLTQIAELGKRLDRLVADDFLFINFQPLKERLVEQPPLLRLRLAVGPLNVIGQGKRLVEHVKDLVVFQAQPLNAFGGADPLSANPGLLVGKQAFADLVGVVRRQELALLPVKLNELHFRLSDFLSGQDSHPVNVRFDGRQNALLLLAA